MATFKVHARVLDLLGEEQIADCPTAISELFKNAYDAYANKVSLDVYEADGYAILWDDGVGMSEEDVLTRWLVVGTPGKKIGTSLSSPPTGMLTRPLMGEKGIGRLAISTLGDTLFLIAKQTTNDKTSYTALLINWNIVRNDRLLLSDIEIPVITFDELKDLESGIADDMVSSFLAPINALKNEHFWTDNYTPLQEKIISQLKAFELNMSMLLRTGLDNRPNGTAFYISDLVSDLPLYVASPNRDESDKDTPQALLVQLLESFQKPFIDSKLDDESTCNPPIEFHADVRKRDVATDTFRSVFDDWQTFSKDDLSIADHHFKINFDKFGRYSGKIKRYDEILELTPDESRAELGVDCGPFSLEFWYWQGEAKESKLTAAQKTLIDKKLALFGGLLLYRDDLRVLPYGRPEFDWLKIEERRSSHAGRNFFSYRRMFGSVSISRCGNPNLRDKAGREGLKTNKEYRDFRKALINFLTSIAKKHFGESVDFKAKKEEVKEQQALLTKQLNRVQEQRKKLSDDLAGSLEIINNGEEELSKLLELSLNEVQEFVKNNSDDSIIQTNINFENRVSKIEERARIVIPSNLSIGRSGKLRQQKHDYETAWPKFKALCMDVRRDFSIAVKKVIPDIETAALRKRAIENVLFQSRSKIGRAHTEIRAKFDGAVETIEAMIEELKREQLNRLEFALLSATSAESVEQALASQSGDISVILGAMGQVAADMEAEAKDFELRLIGYLHEFSDSQGEVITAIQNDEIEDLKEQVEQNLELVQLGLSVEIIDHDLQKLYRGIKTNLSKLQGLWKNAPKSLNYLGELTANFQHLEQRYQLMSPLYRNSYRAKSDFSGGQIFEYLKSFLNHELSVHGVTLVAEKAFIDLSFHEVPAKVLPVFINVIDNAIFWLRNAHQRLVRIDFIGDIVTINDDGPGIHPTMLKEIFKPFVSEKPSGRGLGLYIARANLELSGHEIWAETEAPYKTMSGACFCIKFNPNAIKV